jgi:hypothetical protein
LKGDDQSPGDNSPKMAGLFMSQLRLCIVGFTLGVLLTSPLAADQVFVVVGATTDDEPPIRVQGDDSNFFDLVQEAIEGNGPFTVLLNRDSESVLEYGGAKNAMRFQINAAGNQAELDIPAINLKRTFIAANRAGLYNQIKNYLQNEGRDDYKRFLEAMNRQSAVAVSDGNPNSTTALVAQATFEGSGFGGNESISQALGLGNINLSILADVGQFKSSDIEGQRYSLPLGYHFEITDRVGARIRAPLTYLEVEGAQIFNGSLLVMAPVAVLLPSKSSAPEDQEKSWSSRLGWTISPSLGLAGGGSKDYSAGSLMYVGGLTSVLNYDFGRLQLTLGNQLNYMKGIASNIGDLDVGADVNQWITKNGLKATLPFDNRWVAEVYGIHTAFLKDAAVSNFFTIGVQGGMRLYGDTQGSAGALLLGIYNDVGDDYSSFNVRLGSAFRF